MDPRMARRRKAVAEQRARRSMRRMIVILMFAGAVAGLVWVLRSPLLSIDRVQISGVVVSSVDLVLRESGVVEGEPMISVDADSVEGTLERDPWIVDATVVRRWPDVVLVEVEERIPIAWIGDGVGAAHVAVDGVIIERGEPPEGEPRILTRAPVSGDPGVRIDDRGVLGALEFVDALRSDLSVGAVVDATGTELAADILGYLVRLGRPSDMVAKGTVLAAIVDRGPEAGSEITLISPERPAVLEPSATTTTTLPESQGEEETDQ